MVLAPQIVHSFSLLEEFLSTLCSEKGVELWAVRSRLEFANDQVDAVELAGRTRAVFEELLEPRGCDEVGRHVETACVQGDVMDEVKFEKPAR